MLDFTSILESPHIALLWTAVILLALVGSTWLYNIFLHPLRKIPGPRIAAMTSLYEFYFDVMRDGTYLWEIKKMHEQYGPIVRISPGEIHIDDPQHYSTIYAGPSHKTEKDPSTVAGFAVPKSVAATVDFAHHRSRRGYLNPYFSKQAIVNIEELIHERVTVLCTRLEESMREKSIISLDRAFSAMTADIITQRLYGFHYDYLNTKNMEGPIRDAFLGVSYIFHFARFFPALVQFLRKLPIPLIRCILPSVADFLTLQEEIKKTMAETLKNKRPAEARAKSIILASLDDDRIPLHERGLDRMMDEGTVIIFAGTETSSRALAVGMFYMLSNKSIVTKLRAELQCVAHIPDVGLTLQHLEPLLYLTGVVKECLRLSFGPVSRLPRVFVDKTLRYKDYEIPPGYPLSQSTIFVHTNPEVFPDPYKFEPDRWVDAAKQNFPLNNFLVSFTKGSRQCLGISMAHAELYLTIARVIRNFDMNLENTTVDDIRIHNIRIIGYPKFDKNKGPGQGEVEVLVTNKLI